MQFTSVWVHPSAPIRLAVLFLLAYPFAVWLLSTYRRAGVGPMSASAVPLVLTPILVGAAAGWLGTLHAVESLAITAEDVGRGRRALPKFSP